MESRTVTAVIGAPKGEVFAYLAEIDNLPRWANEFARELKHEDGKTKASTASVSSTSRSTPTRRRA